MVVYVELAKKTCTHVTKTIYVQYVYVKWKTTQEYVNFAYKYVVREREVQIYAMYVLTKLDVVNAIVFFYQVTSSHVFV